MTRIRADVRIHLVRIYPRISASSAVRLFVCCKQLAPEEEAGVRAVQLWAILPSTQLLSPGASQFRLINARLPGQCRMERLHHPKQPVCRVASCRTWVLCGMRPIVFVSPGALRAAFCSRRPSPCAVLRAAAQAVASTGGGVGVQVVCLDWNWRFMSPGQRLAWLNVLTAPLDPPDSSALAPPVSGHPGSKHTGRSNCSHRKARFQPRTLSTTNPIDKLSHATSPNFSPLLYFHHTGCRSVAYLAGFSEPVGEFRSAKYGRAKTNRTGQAQG